MARTWLAAPRGRPAAHRGEGTIAGVGIRLRLYNGSRSSGVQAWGGQESGVMGGPRGEDKLVCVSSMKKKVLVGKCRGERAPQTG